MSDEIALLKSTERAARAEALIGDELLQEAFTYLEREYVKAWRATGITASDTLHRERLWQAVNLLGKVQEHIKRVIENGKLAKRELDDLEVKRSREAKAKAA